MSEMMDRAAAAAREVDPTIWVGEDQQRYFRKVVTAVMESMREPTDEMAKAGQMVNNIASEDATPSNAFEYLSTDEVADAWRAMIDEALK